MKKSCSQRILNNCSSFGGQILPLSFIKPEKKYLVVIAGPTAVGKTDLAIRLAKNYGSVILSADSRQFYKELNIGTAKPDTNQLKEVPHYFIDTKHAEELYGAGHYAKDALQLMDKLFKINPVIFMVGGSGLYIDAVLNGVDDFEDVPGKIREELNASFAEKGLEWLQRELEQKDPEYYNTVDRNNPQRMIRALEIISHSGQPYSVFLKKKKAERDFTAIKIMLNTDRAALYDRINSRVDRMMKQGLLEEVKSLIEFKKFNALKTVGYRELHDYLEGKTDLQNAVEKIKQHTRNYAKRQITWFKNKDHFEEFTPDDFEKIKAYIDIILKND